MRQEHEEANGIAGRHVAERPASSTEASFGLSGTVQRTAPFRATAGAAGGDAPAVHARAGGPVHGREHPHGAVADHRGFCLLSHTAPRHRRQLPETQGLSPSTFALYGAILVKETLIGDASRLPVRHVVLDHPVRGLLHRQPARRVHGGRGRSAVRRTDFRRSARSFSRAPSTCFFPPAHSSALLGVVYASYEIWPVTQLIPLSVFKDINLPLFFAGRVSWLLLMMLLLSGPIVVACLLTDVRSGSSTASLRSSTCTCLPCPSRAASRLF
mgnify:CR=1 FL=1